MTTTYILPEKIEKRGTSWVLEDDDRSIFLEKIYNMPENPQDISAGKDIAYYIVHNGKVGRYFKVNTGQKAISCLSFTYDQYCYVLKELLIEKFDFQSSESDIRGCVSNLFKQGIAHAVLLKGQDSHAIVTPDSEDFSIPEFDVELMLIPLLSFKTGFFVSDNFNEERSLVIIDIDSKNGSMLCTQRLLLDELKKETLNVPPSQENSLNGFKRFVASYEDNI